MPQFIVRTQNPRALADFLAQFGATLDPLAAGEISGKGGGAPLAKGGTVPKTVRGPTNKTGVLDIASRADHEHRLEVEVGTLEDGVISARPRILFSGPEISVEDDPAPQDRTIVRINRSTDGLAVEEGNNDLLLSGSLISYLAPPFTVPDGTWDVEAYMSATVAINYPGDVAATEQVISYRLVLNNTPVASREVSIGSTEAISTQVTLAAHGVLTLSGGNYFASFDAGTTFVGASTATMRWRYMGIRLLRPAV